MSLNKWKGTAQTGDKESDKAILDLLKKINELVVEVNAISSILIPDDEYIKNLFPRWTDVRGIGSIQLIGANAPTLAAYRGNMRRYEFVGSAMREVWCSVQLPHSYKLGSIPRLHVHFKYTSANRDGAIVWQAELTRFNAGGQAVVPLPVTIQADPVQIYATNGQFVEVVADFGPLDMFEWEDIKESAIIEYRLFRDPAYTTDTSTVSAWLDETDVHFLQDKMGTVDEF